MSKACHAHRNRGSVIAMLKHSPTGGASLTVKRLIRVLCHAVSGGEHNREKQLTVPVAPISLLNLRLGFSPLCFSFFFLKTHFQFKSRAGGCWEFHPLCCLGSMSLSNQQQSPLPHTFLVNGFSFGPKSPDHQLIESLMDGLSNVCVCSCIFYILSTKTLFLLAK